MPYTINMLSSIPLTTFERSILNKTIPVLGEDGSFNFYDLVQEAISPDYIFPSQNGNILETFYNIRDFLLANGFLQEKKELVSYILTEKGQLLQHFGSLGDYYEWEESTHVDFLSN